MCKSCKFLSNFRSILRRSLNSKIPNFLLIEQSVCRCVRILFETNAQSCPELIKQSLEFEFLEFLLEILGENFLQKSSKADLIKAIKSMEKNSIFSDKISKILDSCQIWDEFKTQSHDLFLNDVNLHTPALRAFMEVSRSDLPYKQYYCEENIWKFCAYCNNDDVIVVFVSNDDEKDYHVFAILDHKVYDFDTTLEFPCSFEKYFCEAIKFDDNLKSEYHRKFRIIPSGAYLKHFCSDRRHMLDVQSGVYTKEPPPWPAIIYDGKVNNLNEFRRMTPKDNNLIDQISIVLDTRRFYEHFMRNKSNN
uniref:Protein N-terminal glutamine amidohydrolase n=1 Tax=Romanomermis culicivorax TaxID=13658 RepID=A0A915KBE7_ROMCU